MPAPLVRTAIARRRRPAAADAPCRRPTPWGPTDCFPRGDSPTAPPGGFGPRLSPSFCLGCIASRRPSHGLPGRSRRAPPSGPLDTELDAPLGHEQPNGEGGPTEGALRTSSPLPPFV